MRPKAEYGIGLVGGGQGQARLRGAVYGWEREYLPICSPFIEEAKPHCSNPPPSLPRLYRHLL